MSRSSKAVTFFKRFFLLWEHPIWAGLMAFTIYLFFSMLRGSIWGTSVHPYYNYLADAFLHGQFNLRLIPSITNDLVIFNDQYFLYWLPFPAILMMPFVAIFGIAFSDIFFTLCIAGFNVYLVALLLRSIDRHAIVNVSRDKRALFVMFFALGTVHVTLAPFGRIWFTGQLIGFAFTVLAFLVVVNYSEGKAFLLLGIAVACAMLTRGHLVFIAIWPAYHLLKTHWHHGLRRLFGYILLAAIPLIIATSFLGSYNWLRFGNVFDLGLDYHKMAPIFLDDYSRYGAFHWHYFPLNFYYQYIAYPLPFKEDTFMGGSLFLLSPIFFGALWGMFKDRSNLSTWLLLLTIICVNLPILLLMGTGWVQWGPRYTLDFTVPLLLLSAIGIRTWKQSLTSLLLLVSMAHYIGGTLILLRLKF